MDGRLARDIRRSLLRWYGRNRRSLPWRPARSPYAVWIAETMLQQTQVKTVLRYYRRFLQAFPTITALDRAPLERVLALWSGLGYYQRARNLKRAARIIVAEHGGSLPRDLDALRALPGIGPYTAGALMSIAFGRPHPAVDTNARRVLTRLTGERSEKELATTARALVSASRPGALNQALIELGARVCLARAPLCGACPVARRCRTANRLQEGAPVKVPERGPRLPTRKVEWPLFVFRRGASVLLRRRPAGTLLAGLWEIPGGERRRAQSLEAVLGHHLGGLGADPRAFVRIGEVRHRVTRHEIRAPLFLYTGRDTTAVRGPDWRWVRLSSLRRHPISSLTLKAIRRAAEVGGAGRARRAPSARTRTPS